jgi:citrate synthase
MDERLGVKNIGLRGIKVADTRISDVDGERGILIYRGFHCRFLQRLDLPYDENPR